MRANFKYKKNIIEDIDGVSCITGIEEYSTIGYMHNIQGRDVGIVKFEDMQFQWHAYDVETGFLICSEKTKKEALQSTELLFSKYKGLLGII